MKKQFVITHVDILLLLIEKDGRTTPELNRAFGFKSRNYLNKLVKMAQLSDPIIQTACEVFNVDPDVFRIADIVQEIKEIKGAQREFVGVQRVTSLEMQAVKMENEDLRKQIKDLYKRIADLQDGSLIIPKPTKQ